MNVSFAQAEIRRLVEADLVRILNHARVRAPEKGKYPLSAPEILAALRHGTIVEGPAENIQGGWRFTMRRRRDGERMEVAGVLEPGERVIVITAYGDV